MKSKPKILMLSDSPFSTTGYSTMTRNILNDLSDEFECHCIGHNYIGQELTPPIKFQDGEQVKFNVHGCGRAKYSMDLLTHKIRSLDIDIFGILLDTFMAYESGFLGVDTSPAKTFFYYPSDGGAGLPLNCENVLQKVNTPISMSIHGLNQVKKMYNIDCEYIPHAFDDSIFKPYSLKDKLKIKEKWGLTNKFVVGVVARNQGRKMLDKTLKAFKYFCKDKPEAMLFFHCDPKDAAQSFDILRMINLFKLNNRVIFSGTGFLNPFGYKEMADVYNLMDLFFLSTSGEGFGVPIIEAMACGVPQLVTDYTTTKELLIDDIQTGEAIKLVGHNEASITPHCEEIFEGTITGSWNVERGIMSINHAVECLNKLYYDKDLRETYSKNSLIKSKNYTWKKIIPMWRTLFRRMLK